METWYLNPDFLVFDKSGQHFILKNEKDGAMVELSEAEFRLLKLYTGENSYEHVCTQMSDYSLERSLFEQIIEHAKKLRLLIDKNTAVSGKKKRFSVIKESLYYLGIQIIEALKKISHWDIQTELSGNTRFFKLFSIRLNGTLLQKIADSKAFQKALFPLYFALSGCLIAAIVFLPMEFRLSGFALAKVPKLGLFFAMIISLFFCLSIHESGHYLIYKRYGGSGNRIGLGSMFIVFPIMYTQIDNIHFWKNKKQKLLLSLAGIMADVLMWLIIILFLSIYHEPSFLSLLIACLFYYYIMQLLCNLNFLIPGTDGYYLFEDLFSIDRLWGNAYENTSRLWREIRQGKLTKKSLKETAYILYFCSACLNMTLYWLFITLLMTFPLWSNILLH